MKVVDGLSVILVRPSKIKVPKHRFRKDLGDTARLGVMMKAFGWKSPIVVTKGRTLVAGGRRVHALRAMGDDSPIVAQVVDDEFAWIVEGIENIERKNLTWQEEAAFRVKFDEHMRRRHGEAKFQSKEAGKIGGKLAGRGRKRIGTSTVDVPIWSEAKTAEALGISRPTVNADRELLERAKSRPEILQAPTRRDALHQLRKLKAKAALQGNDDFEAKYGVDPGWQTSTLWIFPQCDSRFGVDGYPGRLPGQVVLNLLHLYTKPGDLVVDPFAGGATTVDACRVLRREVKAFDIARTVKVGEDHEREVDLSKLGVVQNDATQEIPVGEGQGQLVILDPPYWHAPKGKYTELPTDLSNMNLDAFYSGMRSVASETWRILHPGGVAVLAMCGEWHDETFYDLSFYCYRIFLDAGFTAYERVVVNKGEQQKTSGVEISRAARGLYLNRGFRDLMVFKKPDGN